MKKLALLFVLIVTLTLSSCINTDTDIANYEKYKEKYEATLFMPDLNKIGEYKNKEFLLRKDESIFSTYSMQLIVEYEKQNYLKEIERLQTAYTYLKEPQKADWDENYYTMPVTEFSLKGYDFKIAKFDDTQYPKNFGMVGVNDQKCKIAYLWLFDTDLDYICQANEDRDSKMIEETKYYFSLK